VTPSSPHARTTIHRSPRTRILVFVLAVIAPLALAQSATGATSVHTPRHLAETRIHVDPRFFGVHDAHLSSLTRPETGSIRLWDTYTTWALLQPNQGPPDFARLDQIVTLAHQNGTEVTMVVAMTPAWAAPDAANPDYRTQMPNLDAYKQFVATLMARYRNFFGPGVPGIANYQVWNEANIDTFWTGTPHEMALLTKAMWQVRNRVDPGARVVAPALEARLPFERRWVKRFYAEKVDGTPVWRFVDAISLNLYPRDIYDGRAGTPEDAIRLLVKSRALLAGDGVPTRLPIWNTEVNYGLGAIGGMAAAPIPQDLQVAYVMRTYLLNAAAGVARVYWYAYDLGNLPATSGGAPIANTLMTSPVDRTSLTPAGIAFQRVQNWLKGSLIGKGGEPPCARNAQGTYTCIVSYGSGRVGRIYWNPVRDARVVLAPSAHTKVTAMGSPKPLRGGEHLTVGYQPVLVRSAA
jgi:hypothetical protein